MAKVLTDKELGEIVNKAIQDNGIIDCADAYKYFLEDLAKMICDHFGGDLVGSGEPDADLPWTVSIQINDCVPSDGGVFKDYDTDVAWKDGKES